MRPGTLQYIVKVTARRAGIKQWKDVYPHCIRKSYDNTIKNSGLPAEDKEFLMGHILPGQSDTYFDKTKIEEFRKKYSEISFFEPSNLSEVRKEAAKDQLRLLESLKVIPADQIEKLYEAIEKSSDLSEINWQDIINSKGETIAKVSQEMTIEQVKQQIMREEEQQQEKRGLAKDTSQAEKLVPRIVRAEPSDLDSYYSQGYKVTFQFNNGDLQMELIA
jgi:hypothetical protein